MKISTEIKKDVSRTIAQYFTAKEIKNILIFEKIIPDNIVSILFGFKQFNSSEKLDEGFFYANQKLIFDVLGNVSCEKEIVLLLRQFCHPDHFKNRSDHKLFIEELNDALKPILHVKYANSCLHFKEVKSTKSKIVNKSTTKNNNSNLNINFDNKNYILYTKKGKSSPIKGGPLRLLRCFLNSESLKCKRVDIIKEMGGEDQHSGARRQLRSLIQGIADIDSIQDENNKKITKYYVLRAK